MTKTSSIETIRTSKIGLKLRMSVIMTEVTLGQIFKLIQNVTEISQLQYCKYCNCSKFENRFQLFDLSPSERTPEIAKLIHIL